MLVSIVIFFVGAKDYYNVPAEGSIFSGILQVFVSAYKKSRLQIPAKDEVAAANVLGIRIGVSNFIPIVGACVADAYLGKFNTIAISSFGTLAVFKQSSSDTRQRTELRLCPKPVEALQHPTSGGSKMLDQNAFNLGLRLPLLHPRGPTRHISGVPGPENGPQHWATLRDSGRIVQRGVADRHRHIPPMLRPLSAAISGKSDKPRGRAHQPPEDSAR
ncbi:hypothetical protein Fmac_012250 [Flemingia macrophylla]|uniref:Uncharacterized protein n=1 Tax=Flemingia macrophylla TaxID=520843 RepID=A0ABD1MPT7_9FABA